MGGQTIGGGIAGVASKVKEEGIKVYNDQTAYNKWEFVYDITKDPMRNGGGAAMPQAGAGLPNAQPPGTPASPGGAFGAPATPSAPGGAFGAPATPSAPPAPPSQ